MYKKPFNLLAILLFISMIFACSEDYLEVYPQASLDESSLANREGVEASLISSYAMLDGFGGNSGQEFGASGSNVLWGSVVADDAYKGAIGGDLMEMDYLEVFNWLPDNVYFNMRFITLYEGISRTNATLRLLDAATDIPETEQSRLEGEALFLRAHFHFEAVKMWKKIPFYNESDLDLKKPNDEDPLPLIIEDLLAAIDQLPEHQEAVGRARRTTAQAYLGKVYLYDHQFQNAGRQFEAVVSSGLYQLQDCFHELFSVAGENGSEMIFAYQSSVNDGATWEFPNTHPDILAFPSNDGPVGCCGFFQPSQNLVNAFRTDEDGLPLPDKFNERDLNQDDFVDPRLDWTVGRDGVPYLNWGPHRPSWIRNAAYAGPFSPKKNVYHQGAGEAMASTGWGAHFSALNFHLLRYADVLLMLAECEVETGRLERARELVNQIRSRAANCAQGLGADEAGIATTLDDQAISWAKYRIGLYEQPWADPEFARKAVRFERRLELAMEGHRLFDLRRWGSTREVMTEYFRVESEKRNYLKSFSGYADRHDLFPIPSRQVELSKVDGVPRLMQNPGY